MTEDDLLSHAIQHSGLTSTPTTTHFPTSQLCRVCYNVCRHDACIQAAFDPAAVDEPTHEPFILRRCRSNAAPTVIKGSVTHILDGWRIPRDDDDIQIMDPATSVISTLRSLSDQEIDTNQYELSVIVPKSSLVRWTSLRAYIAQALATRAAGASTGALTSTLPGTSTLDSLIRGLLRARVEHALADTAWTATSQLCAIGADGVMLQVSIVCPYAEAELKGLSDTVCIPVSQVQLEAPAELPEYHDTLPNMYTRYHTALAEWTARGDTDLASISKGVHGMKSARRLVLQAYSGKQGAASQATWQTAADQGWLPVYQAGAHWWSNGPVPHFRDTGVMPARAAEFMVDAGGAEFGAWVQLKDEWHRTFPCPPPALGRCAAVGVAARRSPLYVAGRYNKWQRGIANSPWTEDDNASASASADQQRSTANVTDALVGPITAALGARGGTMASAGREDVDVRMLGNGRPFVVEVWGALKRTADWVAVEAAIHAACPGVSARQVRVSDRAEYSGLQAASEQRCKKYGALIHTALPISAAVLGKVHALRDIPLAQRTPLRVVHRRSMEVRSKRVLQVTLEPVAGCWYVATITASGGTYIKEFVHGDGGRTQPSLGQLIAWAEQQHSARHPEHELVSGPMAARQATRCVPMPTDIVQLDVLELLDEVSS